MTHPHPDKVHIVRTYRRAILSAKARFGTARSLVHYHDLVASYKTAKREALEHANEEK